jgi:DNA mismatch repair protein MSH5
MKRCSLRYLSGRIRPHTPQIDWEESANEGRVCVRPHIDPELDEWKHNYAGLDETLVSISSPQIKHSNKVQSRAAIQISKHIPADYTDTLNVVYFPQLGARATAC